MSVFAILLASGLAQAQVAPPRGDDAESPAAGMTRLELPDQVELRLLISLVSDQLGINILYNEQVGAQRVTLNVPGAVRTESLRQILESTLRMHRLALAPEARAGWFRIVNAQDLPRISEHSSGDAASRDGPVAMEGNPESRVVTQLFELQHVKPQSVQSVVQSFLTTPGGTSLVLEAQDALIITDYLDNLLRIETIIRSIDRPGRPIEIRFLPIQHLEADVAAKELQGILDGGRAAGSDRTENRLIHVLVQKRTNKLVVIGSKAEVDRAEQIVESIDVSLGLQTVTYVLDAVSPERVDRLARSLIGEARADRLYSAVTDDASGMLVVTAPQELQDLVRSLIDDLDAQSIYIRPAIEFYRLANTTAEDVLGTLSEIQGAGYAALQPYEAYTDFHTGVLPEEHIEASIVGEEGDQMVAPPDEQAGLTPPPPIDAHAPMGFETDRARVVADPATNTLIVIAEPAVQEVYADLIEKLDRRRPQVMIEVTLVTVNTSGSFSLGVEISRSDETGDARFLNFTSFGLSDIDPDTGSLSLTPGLGFNGTVISADIADVVLRALATNGRARVTSAPRIVVNDNASGTLTSAADAPFTSVNASNTVSTTSFGGFESAGTTINVTPHISEDDHLNLEYSVSLSSFTGDAGDGVPPPRQRDEIASVVTIPDGDTIIVGGLTRTDVSETISKVPFLGDIPWLEYALSSRSENELQSTLFVFIRPVILRDDRFRDLRYLSQTALERAGLPPNDPVSVPLMIQ